MFTPRDFRNLDRVFIVAEIGVNHEGNFEVATQLIRQAADCGADAVKFQTFRIENYISNVQPERRQRTECFQLDYDQFRELAAVAQDCGVVFFSSLFHMKDADFLDEIVPFFKISSGDLTYLELIRHVAGKDKPMIVSTGLGTREEIAAAVQAVEDIRPDIRDKGELLLMHCVAVYPTPMEEANLRNIEWLQDEFDLPVGYSDHTLGTKACELAVARGAVALEKHFTYRKENQAFHDHLLSADPDALRELIAAVRQAETYLGQRERKRGAAEAKGLAHMRRAIGAARDIKAGEPVRAEDLTYLRPAWGLPPERFDDLLGKALTRDVPAGDLICE
ncbi:MAG: N-acetylneuraminate synthase family protein, partial [Planctomycetes bacterium]|nr:N-acetylneuraminate synthase family protein [Planctomycetota bacterium]